MKVYAVGGCVRDELLGRIPKDFDYVVVGSSPSEMLALGYEQVGADFPVFLHPVTKNEYALARTERKIGKGYQGFATDFDPSITLEDDLRRRDLTINAMAKDLETGEIIDPFNGMHDLQDQILRHVSPAFAEDPLRVLRVARFRARYGYKIAQSTLELMMQLVSRGELDALTPERVWVEMEKGLSETNPALFLTTLMACDAWTRLFPEVKLGGAFHRLKNAQQLTFDGKLMLIFNDTPLNMVAHVLEKYRASTDTIRNLINFKKVQHSELHSGSLKPEETLSLLKLIDAFRSPINLESLVEPAKTFSAATNFDLFVKRLVVAFDKMKVVNFASLTEDQQKTLKGIEIGHAIDQERLKRIS
jgi:tRNA nucleotidyltransferase (CCA-adding enzyme)